MRAQSTPTPSSLLGRRHRADQYDGGPKCRHKIVQSEGSGWQLPITSPQSGVGRVPTAIDDVEAVRRGRRCSHPFPGDG